MNALRTEADTATDRAEAAEAKNKKYEQELLNRDQEIQSLRHQLGVRDQEIETLEGHVTNAKQAKELGEQSRTESENLSRKIQLLEEELDQAEKNAKETVEKCVIPLRFDIHPNLRWVGVVVVLS
jgi:tropomyosin